MRATRKSAFAGLLTIGAAFGVGPSTAAAQSPGLGGYGATSGDAGPAMGGGGALVIPYGGMSGGFMPSRMGGGSSLRFQARPGAAMGGPRVAFGLTAMSGGMPSARVGSRPMSGGMGWGLGARSTLPGLPRPGGGMGVMPPRIGYPFRQPPSLLAPSSAGAGMSM